MTAKTTGRIPAAKLARYEDLIATDPTIERMGVTIPDTFQDSSPARPSSSRTCA